MDLSPDDYREFGLALLPSGPAWPIQSEDYAYLLLSGLAETLARIHARINVLVEEADPRVTAELLEDWERACGLPSACLAGIVQTVAERRAALVAKLTSDDVATAAHIIAVAAAAGYEISIDEPEPWTVDSSPDAPIYGAEWAYAWIVNAASETVRYWAPDDSPDDPLATWGNARLECIVRAMNPAHLVVIFTYGV
jgi:uncharacterized protein YmfQ (DUF2313 family)